MLRGLDQEYEQENKFEYTLKEAIKSTSTVERIRSCLLVSER